MFMNTLLLKFDADHVSQPETKCLMENFHNKPQSWQYGNTVFQSMEKINLARKKVFWANGNILKKIWRKMQF